LCNAHADAEEQWKRSFCVFIGGMHLVRFYLLWKRVLVVFVKAERHITALKKVAVSVACFGCAQRTKNVTEFSGTAGSTRVNTVKTFVVAGLRMLSQSA
jgi:hypothetical protein